MKHVKTYTTFVSEKIEMRYSTINGKRYESSWAGAADNLKDFIKLLEGMPETLASISVQVGTSSFNPDSEKIKGPFNSAKIKKVINLVKGADKAFNKKGEKIHTYRFESYYGAGGPRHEEDPAYIVYSTESSDKFADDMASGKYGSLDWVVMKEAPMALAHNPTGHLIKILVETLKKVYTYKGNEAH